MRQFRIYYLAPERREAFREKSGNKPPYVIRRSHYEEGPTVCANDPYALWTSLRDEHEAGGPDGSGVVDVGDVLESESGLLLCNFWGFETAEWRENPIDADADASSSSDATSAKPQ